MNNIKNLKYLKSNDMHFYIGWSILVLGLILFVAGEFLWLYILPYQFFFSIGFVIIGVAVTFIPSSTRSKDEDLDFAIKQYTDELSKNISQALEKKLKNPTEPPAVIGRYLLDGDGVIVRKGRRDQKHRSSLYSGAIIAFKKDSLYINQHSLSLISNDQSQKIFDIPYSNHPTAKIEEIITNITNKNQAVKKEHILIINDGEGNQIRIPIINSMMIDEFCENLSKEVEKATKIQATKCFY